MDWVFREPPSIETKLRAAVRDWHRLDETEADARVVAAAELPPEARDRIGITARRLVAAVRRKRIGGGGLPPLLRAYAPSSPGGGALRCFPRALVSTPPPPAGARLAPHKVSPPRW